MNGLHLTADLRLGPAHGAAMTHPTALRQLCLDAVARAGLQTVGELFHRFDASPLGPVAAGNSPPGGVTGVLLLAESHLAVHTWPEMNGVTLDVYVCNLGADNSHRAQQVMDELIAAFEPVEVERHALKRGTLNTAEVMP